MAHPVLFLLTPPSHFVKSASNIPANIKKVEYLFDILNDYDHINAFSFTFNNKLCSLGQALQSHGSNGTEYDTRTVTSGDCISTGTERAKHNPSQGEGRLSCLGSCIWTACASEVTTWHEKRWAFARPPSRHTLGVMGTLMFSFALCTLLCYDDMKSGVLCLEAIHFFSMSSLPCSWCCSKV